MDPMGMGLRRVGWNSMHVWDACILKTWWMNMILPYELKICNYVFVCLYSTITLLHGKINPKDWQLLSLGDVRFLLFFRVVSSDYGKPWYIKIYVVYITYYFYFFKYRCTCRICIWLRNKMLVTSVVGPQGIQKKLERPFRWYAA